MCTVAKPDLHDRISDALLSAYSSGRNGEDRPDWDARELVGRPMQETERRELLLTHLVTAVDFLEQDWLESAASSIERAAHHLQEIQRMRDAREEKESEPTC